MTATGIDGVSDFNALHSHRHDDEVQLYAFDILALDGEDLRGLPLSMSKTNLARLLSRRPDGILAADFEQGEIGPDLFRAACDMGLEGLVSKHRERPYQGGRSKFWVKVKNRKHASVERVMEAFADGTVHGRVWDELPPSLAWKVVTRGALSAFYSHPWAWNEIGFGGPAYPRGFARLAAGQRESWEGAPAFERDPVKDTHERGVEGT